MSTVETPQPAEQPAARPCPRCGAAMSPDQEWCLRCGAAVGTRVVAAPGWRVPIAIATLIVVLAAIAVTIAIVQLADDTDQVAQTPAATVTPAPTAAASVTPDPTIPEVTPTITPEPTASPEPTTTPDTGTVGTWPAGKSGWTVVLASDTSESSAQSAAEAFAGQGIPDVGVLNSDDFGSLKPGFWVVFSGEYDDQSAASDALDGIDAPDAYIRRIAPS